MFKILPVRIVVVAIGAAALIFGLVGCKSKPAPGQGHLKGKEDAACTADDIKLAINPNNHQFPKQMDECASDAWGNAKKTTKCLKTKYAALSDACARCFGEMATCSASNCKWKCIGDHFSEKCLACVSSSCRDAQKGSFSLVECTGLKPNELPPSK